MQVQTSLRQQAGCLVTGEEMRCRAEPVAADCLVLVEAAQGDPAKNSAPQHHRAVLPGHRARLRQQRGGIVCKACGDHDQHRAAGLAGTAGARLRHRPRGCRGSAPGPAARRQGPAPPPRRRPRRTAPARADLGPRPGSPRSTGRRPATSEEKTTGPTGPHTRRRAWQRAARTSPAVPMTCPLAPSRPPVSRTRGQAQDVPAGAEARISADGRTGRSWGSCR